MAQSSQCHGPVLGCRPEVGDPCYSLQLVTETSMSLPPVMQLQSNIKLGAPVSVLFLQQKTEKLVPGECRSVFPLFCFSVVEQLKAGNKCSVPLRDL